MVDKGLALVQSFANNADLPFEVRVLVVDDDAVSLMINSGILKSLKYQVVGTKHPLAALEELRKNQSYFDLIVMDVHMPDIDGFSLKHKVDAEYAIPVIMISADHDEKVITKALKRGVVRYILKPATPDDFKGIWQFVKTSLKGKKQILAEETRDFGEESLRERTQDQNLNSQSPSKESRLITQNDNVLKEPMTAPKKTKIAWTKELRTRFLEAITSIGLDRANPKRILEAMDVQGLTRENVASHLQKYRAFLREVAQKFTNAMDSGNDKNALLSSIASRYSSVTLRDIQHEYDKLLEQRGIRNCNPSYRSISKSLYRSEQLYLWNNNNPTNSHHSLPIETNPTAQVGLSARNINDLISPYQLTSASNVVQIYHKPPPRQQLINPSGSVNNNFTRHASAQTPGSEYTNYNAGIGITTSEGNVGMSQMQKKGNGVSNTFCYGDGLINEANINNVMPTGFLYSNNSYLVGGGVCPAREVYNANQSLAMSMGTNNMENMLVERLYPQEQQHIHQLSSEGNCRSFAIGDNNDTSNFTSHMSQFSGIHYGGTSKEGCHGTFSLQYGNREVGSEDVFNPANCTVETATANRDAPRQKDNEVVTADINANLHPSDDYIPSFNEISSQLQNNVDSSEFDVGKISQFEQFFSDQDWDEMVRSLLNVNDKE